MKIQKHKVASYRSYLRTGKSIRNYYGKKFAKFMDEQMRVRDLIWGSSAAFSNELKYEYVF